MHNAEKQDIRGLSALFSRVMHKITLC